MNKGELIERIASSTGLSKVLAGRALGVAIESITGEVAKGGTVSIIGFGTFSANKRGAIGFMATSILGLYRAGLLSMGRKALLSNTR